MLNWIKKIFANPFQKKYLILISIFWLILSGLVSLPAHSQQSPLTTPDTCKEMIKKQEVKIWDLPNINKFLPIIPLECGMNNGKMQQLGIAVIPDIIIRVLGLLFVLAFYLFPGAIVLLGFNLALKPFDPSINKSQFTEITTLPRLITKQIGGIFIGLVLILFAYTIVFTILKLIGFSGEYTNLENFFELP
jgi:hypothetical protein